MLKFQESIRALQLPDSISERAVFVDGRFSKEASKTGWNISCSEGLTIFRPDRDGELALLHVGEASPAGSVIRIEVPPNHHVRVLEGWTGTAGGATGRELRISIQAGASLEWICWQSSLSSHRGRIEVDLERDGRLDWFQLDSKCEKVISPIQVRLNGANAEACLYGLSFAQGTSEIEQNIEVRHQHPHTRSRQMFKSVLRDRAKGIFAGRVIIARDAQKSDASQRHQSLCFHSSAEAVTRPELEDFGGRRESSARRDGRSSRRGPAFLS